MRALVEKSTAGHGSSKAKKNALLSFLPISCALSKPPWPEPRQKNQASLLGAHSIRRIKKNRLQGAVFY